ncbi:phage head-tail adaptor [Methylorubrum populi BJ001]|jgi:head-tail adaptor|uniref:Phage head-tail adaptor n=1 Tax=Methylorubrum populi (strain ATCC BAA-705 / NCIMB 13946 / BJ001) TaxID=441620 RepID=B1ZCW8_METPB|nr:head-tail adaptor protein [Methylorubrum populi]ACB80837.1 phage head-tail adaptor [Methylorubrum populi BJ001]
MATAGERTSFCDILQRPPRSTLGETETDISKWSVWSSAWAKKQGLRGGELTLARETSQQETEDFWFAYEDVMDPLGDGDSLNSKMVLRVDNGTPAGLLYDIDGVFPDEVHRKEVRVRGIRKRLPV